MNDYMVRRSCHFLQHAKSMMKSKKKKGGGCGMTKYQYNVNKNSIEENGKFVAYLNSVYGFRIANKLNVLSKENEQLKASNILLKNEMSWIKDCAYWREKEAFNKLFGYYMITVDEYRLMEKENQILIKQQEALQETTLYDAIKYARELEDSNTELYKENMNLKRLIKDAYETERTMLGKSVLKQLLDQM